jgi:hypothetical protein
MISKSAGVISYSPDNKKHFPYRNPYRENDKKSIHPGEQL